MTITPQQVRGARAMLQLSRSELAQSAEVAERTLIDFENKAREPRRGTLLTIKDALERAGCTFIDADEHGGPGVRLRKPAA